MKQTPLITLAMCALWALTACQTRKSVATSASSIRLTPVVVQKPVPRQPGMREGQDLSRLTFHIQTPWTTGPIEMRFPETLRSSAGFHYLDHYVASITPTAEWQTFPQWQTDATTGRLYYDFKTPDRLHLMASVTPVGDEVQMEFTVANETAHSLRGVEGNCCLTFGDCPELNDKGNPAMLFAVLDGRFQSLAKATPTPAQMKRTPWFLIIRPEAEQTTDLPKVSPTWWRIDQHHTENLMAAVTRDGKHLVGYTWNVEPVALMSNGNNPCLHTGMGFSPEIPPGKSFTWRGKIYLLPNDPNELLQRYRRDQRAWNVPSASQPNRQ